MKTNWLLCLFVCLSFGCNTTKLTTKAPTPAPREPKWVLVDTLLQPVTDYTKQIVGTRNLVGQNSGSIKFTVPLNKNITDGSMTKDSLVGIAYWVGIGSAANSAYEGLTGKVPAEWRQPGISPPLAAYAQGYPITLPATNSQAEAQFRYNFVDTQGRRNFTQQEASQPLFEPDPDHANYGLVRGAQLQQLATDSQTAESLLFYLVFANDHPINTQEFRVLMIAVYNTFELK